MSFKDYAVDNPFDDNNPITQTKPQTQQKAGVHKMSDLSQDLLSQLQEALALVPKLEEENRGLNAESDTHKAIISQNQDMINNLSKQITDLQDKLLKGGGSKDWQQAIEVLSEDEVIAQLCGSCIGLDETVKEFITASQQQVNPLYEWPDDMNPTDATQYVPRKVAAGHHVLFTGPTGTGKTETAQNLLAYKHGAWAKVSFHMGTKYGSLFAQMQAAEGRTYTMLGVIVLSMITGIPLILDEVDHCDEFVQSMLHEIVERKSVFIPEINKTIHAKEGWQCVATCNSLGDVSGMYHGMMGTAFADRFAVWYVGYPDFKTEVKIIDTATGVKKDGKHKVIANIFKDLRSKVGEELTGPFSLRRSIQIALDMKEGVDAGLPVETALEQAAMANLIYRNNVDEQKVIAEVYQAHTGSELPVFAAR